MCSKMLNFTITLRIYRILWNFKFLEREATCTGNWLNSLEIVIIKSQPKI